MVQVFVSHTKEDAGCANAIRQGLEGKGYTTWREPPTLSFASMTSRRALENAILGSAALVLVWSQGAAQSEWVEQHVLLAQRLKKPVIPVTLDGAELPNTLTVVPIHAEQVPCADIVSQLLPYLPSPASDDPLIALWEQASHDSLISIDARKTAIEQAANLLRQPSQPHREAALALLEYLMRHDPITMVRDKARAVLEEDARKVALVPPPPFTLPDDSRHIFAVRCKKCDHLSYFDKRRVCSAQYTGVRKVEERAGTKLHRVILRCEREQCHEEMPVSIDCEGYR
jgi:hypothetical protein